MKASINRAKKTLIGNRRKGYTLPTNNKLYPAQWNWDSGFIALGYSYFNLNFALKEINTLLDGQWKDGMVPHILFHNTKTNYYPTKPFLPFLLNFVSTFYTPCSKTTN